jgi:hypothetical protein
MPLFKQFCKKKIPCLVVACKSDLPLDPALVGSSDSTSSHSLLLMLHQLCFPVSGFNHHQGQKPIYALREYGMVPVAHSNLGKQAEKLPVLAIEHAVL